MEVLIDTSFLIRIEKNSFKPEAIDRLLGRVAAVTVAELWHGVFRADTPARRQRRQADVERLLSALTVLDYDTDVARTHARIWADLQQRGEVIGPYDLQIAATAVHHDLPVLTLNVREFARVSGVQLVEL